MIKITRFFYINPICIPLFTLAYFTDSLSTLLLAYCTAAVHELFHLLAALMLSVRIKSIIIMPFGITLRLSESVIKSPGKEVIVAVFGPFANLVMIIVAKIMEYMYIWSGAGLFLFIYLNVAMFFINMLPCMPLDGGRVFRAVLVGRIGYLNTVSFQKKVEKVIMFVLGILGILLMIITEFNISLIMIAAFLIYNMTGEENRKNYVIMREIMNYNDKLNGRKYMRAKSLAVRGDVKAIDIMKRTGYDSFYIINVIDNKSCIKNSITESEIIDGIREKSAKVTLDEIVKRQKKRYM